MVFAGEGLRAPRLPIDVSPRAAPLSGRAVSGALIGAAAAAGIAGSVATANQPIVAPQAIPTSISRTAPVPSTNAINPLLSAAGGLRAPSLGGANMPRAGDSLSPMNRGLPSASGAAPNGLSSTAAGMIPALVGAAANAGIGQLTANPKSPFYVQPQFRPGTPEYEAKAANDRSKFRDDAGNLARQFGDFLADPTGAKKRAELERVGNKFRNPPRKGNADEKQGKQLNKPYRVTFQATLSNPAGDVNTGGTFTLLGPIGPVVITPEYRNGTKYLNANISTGGGTFNVFQTANDGSSASITNITPVDGVPDPPLPASPDSFNPGDGLALPTLLGNTPVLPNTGLNQLAPTKSPTTGSPTIPIRPDTPLPSAQPSGEASKQPQAPSPTLPSLNSPLSSPSLGLPTIPAAPTTGSATLTAPIFPSSFTQTPTQRNSEALKPLQPNAPRVPQPGTCADPCMATLQRQQEGNLEALQGLEELLSRLLDGQQQQLEQQEEQKEKDELITVNAQYCNCHFDGTSERTEIPIQVKASESALILHQFSVLAEIQSILCAMERFTERTHNILGGDVWFRTPEGRAPEYKLKVERKLKEVGSVFGFPDFPPETPESIALQEEQALLTGIPIPGQVKVKNLISLINLYTSNLYHRAGYQGLPASVPQTLLGYTDEEPPQIINDFSTYFAWFVKQVDALIGKFPINITIEDVDPLTEGNQTKQIELPNISEALAEMYGINIATSVNADVSVNFLMRLASEIIATKNSTLITQDYARANAAFLGYKGNPARREINYSFNPAKLDSLDEFLKESKGYVVGWEEDDKESVVGFLQRIVFSAGIIKSVFFKDSKRLAELQKELESMITGDKAASDAEWDAILALINNPEEYFNKDSIPHPRVRNKPTEPPPENPA